MTTHDLARSWLQSQILSHGGCIERLAAIQNDAVNVEAQAATLERMRGEVEVWRYLLELVEGVS